MSRREKIIVFIAFLTVLYGAYDFFIVSPAKKSKSIPVVHSFTPVAKTVDMNKLVKEISDVLQENETIKAETYVAVSAEKEWKNDPFSASNALHSKNANVSIGRIKEIRLIYSGYLEVGKKKIAVINGMDYQIGDELEMNGYRVKHITPSSVTVVDTRRGGKITVPFLAE
ncbi:MAG: hypothetical protein JXC33_07790 [Deltaproteobacteria bacterium]|nr:hypothetical protein [Deltaproteobacteria bacterium]